MADDIVEWLRWLAAANPKLGGAADEIERLRAQVAHLEDIVALAKRINATAETGSASPQAPVARVTVEDSGIVSWAMYAPGLPAGKHEVYAAPMSVAPALPASEATGTERLTYPHADEPLMWFDRDRAAAPASASPAEDACLDIHGDIDAADVPKMPMSIQIAWRVGQQLRAAVQPSAQHVCGLQGFGAPEDRCPACEAARAAR